MKFFTIIILCVICFGAGWLFGIKNVKDIEEMVDGVDEAVNYLDSLDFEAIHLNNTSANIDLLIHLDNKEEEDAKRILINMLREEYNDMHKDLQHEELSNESKIQMDRINDLSRKYKSFQDIISK